MDCAEGTYGQILDYCGSQAKANEVLNKTKVIYISHFHGDHVLGLARFLHERDLLQAKLNSSCQSKVFVVAPPCLSDYVQNAVSGL